MRAIIIEDEALVAAMLADWLGQTGGMEVAGCAADGERGLQLCRLTKPELAIVDIRLPDMDGIELVEQLLKEFPALKVIFLSGRCEPYHVHRIARLGAQGFVEKAGSPQILADAVRAVAGGKTYFTPLFRAMQDELLRHPMAFQKKLSRREIEILQAVARGWRDDEIARRLNISPFTVATHRRNLRSKLRLHNDRDLLNYAREWGLAADAPAAARPVK